MKQLLSLFLLATLSLTTTAQDNTQQSTNKADLELKVANRMRADATTHGKTALNTASAPFYHGVASGDPLQDRVIIWTRVTDDDATAIDVTWQMATDPQMTDIVVLGQVTTDASKDFTVKVDVEGLEPQTTYYYNFSALGETSVTGRTRTAATTADHLKFGIVSCSNYQSGYYNAYARLSELNDLDAIIHLGDYIYEYHEGGYGYTEEVGRGHEPTNEIISLEDYRTRYSFYRLDADLQAIHQQHPFIHMWDDHETANDSYKDGAENHNEGEGDWEVRKSNGKQAFYEWLPMRNTENNKMYRSISYGDMAEIIILDTRLEGRTKQAESVTDPDFESEERTILGETQREWFKDKLANSDAQWKLVANQVVFSPLALESLIALTELAEQIVVDIWEGYPADQAQIVNFITDNDISNIAFLTGDVHVTFGLDVAADPANPDAYNPATGEGSIAVEMVTPSITSDGYDEVLGTTFANLIQGALGNTNPQLKKVNLFDHGYYILDVTPEKLQGDWYYVETHLEPTDVQSYGNGLFTNNNDNYLQETTTAAPPKETQEAPAPNPVGIENDIEMVKNFVVLANYPNPTSQMSTLNYGLSKPMNVNIALFDVKGQLISQLVNGMQEAGLYSLSFNAEKLAKGTYFYKITTDEGTISQTLVVQ